MVAEAELLQVINVEVDFGWFYSGDVAGHIESATAEQEFHGLEQI